MIISESMVSLELTPQESTRKGDVHRSVVFSDHSVDKECLDTQLA